MYRLGQPELVIILVIVCLVCAGATGVLRPLGLRSLTFGRRSDLLIGIGLVLSFLAAILFLRP